MDDNNILDSGEPSAEPYKPLHEKLPEECAENAAASPVYDDFMYEPIGFEELEKTYTEEKKNAVKPPKRAKSETAAILLFALLLAVSGAAAAVGIVKDVADSKNAVNKLLENRQPVFYSAEKPEGANDPSNFVDEDGKYTIEGAAAAVKDSIVEIYTYTDGAKAKLSGTGSGVIVSEDGYIVTNAHVLLEKGYHLVETTDGKVYEGKIIGRDTKTDLAVIRIKGTGFLPAVLGNSDEAIIGEKVIAIGNPAGLSSTVTDGIVSYVGRMIRGESDGYKMSCIQTNAQISPGNSGGALVNMYGQVIGLSVGGMAHSAYEGIGFAIEINDVIPIAEELMKNGFIKGRARVGVAYIPMTTELAAEYGVPVGICVAEIDETCDVAKKDIQIYDIITHIDGMHIYDAETIEKAMENKYAGQTVTLTVYRKTITEVETTFEVEIVLAQKYDKVTEG